MLLGHSRSDAILRTLAFAGFLGAVSGAAFSPDTVKAVCTQDECEGGNRCVPNEGHQTQCNALTSGCATDACGIE
jgi:hypothetical protein